MSTIQSSLIKLLDAELPGQDNKTLAGKVIAVMASAVVRQIAQAEKMEKVRRG